MDRLRIIFTLGLVLEIALIGIGCSNGKEVSRSNFQLVQPNQGVPVVPNRSRIIAKVVGVKKLDYPKAELTLQIKEINDILGYKNLLTSKKEIKAYPQFITDYDGSILMLLPQNTKLFELYNLSIGKRISAEITYCGDEKRGGWEIINWYEIERET